MAEQAQKPEKYQRRRPELTPCFKIVNEHMDSFVQARESENRPLPQYVIDEFEAFIKCGIPAKGYTSSTQTLVVVGGSASLPVIDGPSEVQPDICAGPYFLSFKDSYQNPASYFYQDHGPLDYLESQSTYSFYTTNDCSGPALQQEFSNRILLAGLPFTGTVAKVYGKFRPVNGNPYFPGNNFFSVRYNGSVQSKGIVISSIAFPGSPPQLDDVICANPGDNTDLRIHFTSSSAMVASIVSTSPTPPACSLDGSPPELVSRLDTVFGKKQLIFSPTGVNTMRYVRLCAYDPDYSEPFSAGIVVGFEYKVVGDNVIGLVCY